MVRTSAKPIKPSRPSDRDHAAVSPTDVFARFVDVIAAGLDEPDLDGANVARRAYMSRAHFDRVVAAAAGETPARFRRRIRLERAAYQLVTSADDVLDIGVRAGYGSHEAFTRAFARAFGQPPSQWRRNPGPRLRLDAPSGVHFHPPGGLSVPARRKVTDMELLQRMLGHHVWLLGEIVDRAARLDDETLDRPIEISVEYLDDEPTIRSALSRLIGQLDMWSCAVAGREYDWSVEQHESVASQRTRLDRVAAEFTALADELVRESRLDESFVDALCEPAEVFTYGGMLAHVLAFGTTRRTIVIGALHSAGITDLGVGDPMHWVAEPA